MNQECQCPNLLSGHLSGCSQPARKENASFQKELESKLGSFAHYAKNAVLYAANDETLAEAKEKGISYSQKLEIHDLVLVEENLGPDRSVLGPWIGIVSDLHPVVGGQVPGSDGLYEGPLLEGSLNVVIVDSLGNKIAADDLMIDNRDKVFILRRE